MKLLDHIRAAVRGPMYPTVIGKGIEAIVLIDGKVKGVVTVSPTSHLPKEGDHA